eukprot:TRINITY_DN84007_c0_g1_i1.p1 TRINITY_DN84007_c0_g1~~TRINITY_DN84007_c0_g1_i1.p1  ORF type:complete len:400 (-),score=44.92 TRINITY_DN84007_c0_g1_i1:217-1416(-)
MPAATRLALPVRASNSRTASPSMNAFERVSKAAPSLPRIRQASPAWQQEAAWVARAVPLHHHGRQSANTLGMHGTGSAKAPGRCSSRGTSTPAAERPLRLDSLLDQRWRDRPMRVHASPTASPKMCPPETSLPSTERRNDAHRLADELDMPDPDFQKVRMWTASLKAQEPGLLEEVWRRRLQEPAEGLAAVHKAASAGCCSTVKEFLSAGGDVNLGSSMGFTPLHCACSHDRPEMVAFLLERGADPNKPSLGGSTPLQAACLRKADSCVLRLLRDAPCYVVVDQEDASRGTAVKTAKSKLVRWLLAYYKEFPSMGCKKTGAWGAEQMLAALSKEEEAQFGLGLRCLLTDRCCCTTKEAVAVAFPRMPLEVMNLTREYLPACSEPSSCLRTRSMPRLRNI